MANDSQIKERSICKGFDGLTAEKANDNQIKMEPEEQFRDFARRYGTAEIKDEQEAAEIINDGTYSVGNIYECDPEKNTECNKRGCYINGGECRHTTHAEYVKEDQE